MRRAGDPRGGGTSAWVTAVRERRFPTPTIKLLMMVLCDYIDGDDCCWPGNTTLAPDVGVDEKTIKRSLTRLELLGIIARERRTKHDGRGGKLPDVIRFLWDGFQQLDLVEYDGDPDAPPGDKLSPNPPPDQEDNLSPNPGGQGDICKGLGDTPGVEVRGQISPLSSFRTPSSNPPTRTPRASALAAPSLALVPLSAGADLARQDDVERLCALLAELVEANGSKRPPVTARWRQECDRLIRIDGRTAEQVERAIRWSQADGFWCTNVLSMPTLRKHYDRLRLAARRQAGGPAGPVDAGDAYLERRRQVEP